MKIHQHSLGSQFPTINTEIIRIRCTADMITQGTTDDETHQMAVAATTANITTIAQ
jgi:hypothetical protein